MKVITYAHNTQNRWHKTTQHNTNPILSFQLDNISYSQYDVLQNPKTSLVVLTSIRKNSCRITSSAALPPSFVPWSLKQRSTLQPHMQTGPVTLMFSTQLFWCEHLHQVNLILLLFIFRPTKDEEKRKWKRLHKEKLHDLNSSPNIIRISRRMRWAVHVARMREGRGAYGVLVGKPEERRPHGRPRGRWDDTKMDLQKIGWGTWTTLIWLSIRTASGLLWMR